MSPLYGNTANVTVNYDFQFNERRNVEQSTSAFNGESM